MKPVARDIAAEPDANGPIPHRDRRHGSLGRSSGVAAVELALVLPILLAIVIATIDFSVLLYNQALLTNAAREGARWGIIKTNYDWTAKGNCTNVTVAGAASPCEIANGAVASRLINFGPAASPFSTATGSSTVGATVEVTVSVVYKGLFFSFHPFDVGENRTLSAKAKMLHE